MAAATILISETLPTILGSETCVPVETYLESMYHPDRDYVDGQILERNVGEKPHARLQRYFILAFAKYGSEWNLEVLPEQRVQVGPTRYRVADICVITAGEAGDELIVSRPPVLCVEVLSREDRMSEMQERVEDYLKMGVGAVWLVDPWRRKAFSVQRTGEIEPVSDKLTVRDTPVVIPVDEMFKELDRFAPRTVEGTTATE